MKQLIIATITLAVGVGTATFFFTRSSKRKAKKPTMTFMELYKDNLCFDNGLFD